MKNDEGTQAARALGPNATFHHVDLRNYDALGAAFNAACGNKGGRLDFVFANAGLIEKSVMFDLTTTAAADADDGADGSVPSLPPRPDYAAVEVNLQGAVDTVHLARHFMLRSPAKEKGAIVVSASCAGVWPAYWAPIYTASKCKLLYYTCEPPSPPILCLEDSYFFSVSVSLSPSPPPRFPKA